jgi:CubicO group peptidase (beta-lactamase class C family)
VDTGQTALARATVAAGEAMPVSGWADPQLAEAIADIDRFVAREMAVRGTPGLALAITDRSGLLAVRNCGFADLGAKAPVRDDTLFALGSIGKALTAVCAIQMADEGAIDLDAPVTRYLPWFAVRSEHPPITVHHLLAHTAGIVYGSDYACDSRYQVWALRQTTVGGPPGERFYYSNVGYKALGFLLETVAGKPYGEIVQERIIAPLRMEAAASVITHDVRRRLAVGYVPFYDDRPYRPRHGLVPATWLETHTGDGSQAASAAALCDFLRMLLDRGDAPGTRLLTDHQFELMLGPHAEMAPGHGHGYGLITTSLGGHPALGHDGDMVGYASAMTGLLDAGIGAVTLINGPGDANAVVEFALLTIAAALAGEDPPPMPPAGSTVANADEYTGTYRGEHGAFAIVAADAGPTLLWSGAHLVLEPTGDDVFLADHPDFALFPLRFGRNDGGEVVEAAHGPAWYANERYAGPATFAVPPEWLAFPGHYRTHTPWTPNFRVVLRKGELRLIWPHGDELVLRPEGAGFRLDDDPWYPERIAFDTVVDGVALRAGWTSGEDYAYRFFTP